MFAASFRKTQHILAVICLTGAATCCASDEVRPTPFLHNFFGEAVTAAPTEAPTETPGASKEALQTSGNSVSKTEAASVSMLEQSESVAESHHRQPQTCPNDNIGSVETSDSSVVMFSFLNYVMLSCDQAFQSDDPTHEALYRSPASARAVPVSGVSQENPDSSNRLRTSEGRTSVVGDSSEKSLRSMSTIRLSDAVSNTTESGDVLMVPDADSAAARKHPIEHHFVPVPWHAPPVSRNTFRIRYQPLYFEDPNLERCDDAGGVLTEFRSIAHFGGRIPLLPYMMASDSPHDCVNALPDCPACHQFGPHAYLPKPTIKAIAAQAAATVGTAFIIP